MSNEKVISAGEAIDSMKTVAYALPSWASYDREVGGAAKTVFDYLKQQEKKEKEIVVNYYDTEISEELDLNIKKFSLGIIKTLDSILQNYRDMCSTDEEFSRRMSKLQFNSNATQYYFDSEPVFYTKTEILDYKFVFTFYQGHYRS